MGVRRGMVSRAGVVTGGVAALLGAGGLIGVVPASAQPVSAVAALTQTFYYRGAVAQTVIVPGGVTSAQIRLIGGKGGSTGSPTSRITGGDGALFTGTMKMYAGQQVTVKVAGRGGDGDGNVHPGDGGWGYTGSGGRGGSSSLTDGAGGGGASGIELTPPFPGQTQEEIAGGGGGAGGSGFGGSLAAGGPGGSSGTTVDPGHNGKGGGAGKGGAGRAETTGNGGAGGNGSNAGGAGGGGGAGVHGGGGGGGGSLGGGGGGGGGAGSSLLRLPGRTVVRGTTPDGNGLVEITWNNVTGPICYDQSVYVPANSTGTAFDVFCGVTAATRYRIVAPPLHGRLVAEDLTTGRFIFVPDKGYKGTDSMLMQAFSGDSASPPYRVDIVVTSAPVGLLAADQVAPGAGGETAPAFLAGSWWALSADGTRRIASQPRVQAIQL